MRCLLPGLVLFLSFLASAAPARAEWRRAVSTHFIIYSEGSAEALRIVAERLERFDGVLRRLTPVRAGSAASRLVVYMPASADTVARIVGNSNAAGVYVSDPAGPFAITPRFSLSDSFTADVILFHEYVHHFMLQHFSAAYPPWFVEGYAELFSTTSFERDGSIVVGGYASHRAWSLQGDPPPLRAIMFRNRELDGHVFYANAWYLTHYLLVSPERPGQLHAYIRLIGSGRPPEEAAEEAFSGFERLERDFIRYRRASRIPILRLRSDQVAAAGPVTIETLTPGEENLLWQQVEYRRTPTGGRLAGLLRRVRAGAAETPGDPATLQLLADVETLAGNLDAATRAVDALLARQPAAPRALLRKGLIEMAVLERDRVTDPARWTAARDWLRRANRAGPDDALILYEYYRAFERQGIDAPDPAVAALGRAYELVPQSFDLRLRLGREFVRGRQYRNAVAVLSPVAYSVHGGRYGAAAQRVIDLIRPLADGAAPPPEALTLPTSPAEAR